MLTPSALMAHIGSDIGAHHFAAGFRHPFTGWDHVLAMTAIGMWAAQLGGPARWRIPAAFLSLMAAGGLLAAAHFRLPFVEAVILASVLISGLLVLLAMKLPTTWGIALAGLFAIFHGHAHIAEMHRGDSALAYGTGFILAAAILIATGFALATLTLRARRPLLLRATGAAVAMGAIALAVT